MYLKYKTSQISTTSHHGPSPIMDHHPLRGRVPLAMVGPPRPSIASSSAMNASSQVQRVHANSKIFVRLLPL